MNSIARKFCFTSLFENPIRLNNNNGDLFWIGVGWSPDHIIKLDLNKGTQRLSSFGTSSETIVGQTGGDATGQFSHFYGNLPPRRTSHPRAFRHRAAAPDYWLFPAISLSSLHPFSQWPRAGPLLRPSTYTWPWRNAAQQPIAEAEAFARGQWGKSISEAELDGWSFRCRCWERGSRRWAQVSGWIGWRWRLLLTCVAVPWRLRGRFWAAGSLCERSPVPVRELIA